MSSREESPTSAETAVVGTVAGGVPDVTATVRAILARYSGHSLDDIPLTARLEYDLDLDSFAMIEITVALEERWRISMGNVADPRELNLVTVSDLVAYVNSQLAARQPEEKNHARSDDRRA
jgi:acyl carrier protein